jgi:OmpA-OmpF porin, OOP family
MKCNPIRWLWGLIPLAALAGMMFLGGVPGKIQDDLRARAEGALGAGGFGWASTAFSGRDAVVLGDAVDESDQKRVGGVVRSTWGVRVVDDQSKLLDEEKNFVWSAVLRSNKLQLSGFAPTQKARTEILGMARATFPGREIVDGMKLARGVPAKEDAWLGWIAYGMKQLAGLKSGQVGLEATNLTVEGEANDNNTYKGIRNALANQLPQGVKLKNEKVTAPAAKPYTWAAKYAANQVQLTGHVPGERAREDVFAAAKKAFPKAAIIDKMETASGEPKDWSAAAAAALARLATFDDGSAEMRDSQLTLSGLAPDQGTADEARKALKSLASFKTSDQIKVREPTAPVANPFITGIAAGNGVVALTGYVPSDAARLALIESVKARLPGQKIDDKLQIASGAPEGWLGCVQGGLLGVGRLGAGRVELNGNAMDLVGSADDAKLPDAVTRDVKAAIGTQCNSRINIGLSARAEAAAAEARRANDQASASAAEAARLAAAAEAAKRDAASKADADAKTLAARKAKANECQVQLADIAKAGKIQFRRASAELDPASFATLTQLANATNGCPGMGVEIEGHTDAEGVTERNQALSERRAQSVRNFLISAGVTEGRLKAIGYGELKPIAPNDTAENRAINRRIEFTVKPQ